MGASVYSIARNLAAPRVPKNLTYAQLKNLLEGHFKLFLIIAKRFKFHRRDQKPQENVSDYVLALKELAATRDFGEFQEQALRDRLVCCLRSEATQKKLLAEKDLAWKTAQDIALAMEMAAHEARSVASSMGATGKTADVNKVSQTQPQSQSKQRFYSGTGTCKQPADKSRGQGQGNKQRTSRQNCSKTCFRCGWDHHSGECRYKNAECRKCGKIGHIARRCSQNRRKNYATNPQGPLLI